ncbi:unnamed protein product [Prunus brigantina]
MPRLSTSTPSVARPPQRVILLLILHLLQHPPRHHLNILLPPQVPRMSSTPKGKIATSIHSTITSGADMATTTSPAEATHTGQVIGLHSPSHPSLGSRSSPP